MLKLAVFVEGLTEVLMIERLLEELVGPHNIVIEQKRIQGGRSVPVSYTAINAARPISGQRFYVLIFDCGGDHQVATRIKNEHGNLTKNGYAKIIGVRDVRPDFSLAQIPQLEAGLMKFVLPGLIPVEFILATMEIEAWFLAEVNHFVAIDPSITVARISTMLGFDPSVDDLALRPNPASDLGECYALGGKTYFKGSQETVAALDVEHLYLTIAPRIPYLNKLCASLDEFLA